MFIYVIWSNSGSAIPALALIRDDRRSALKVITFEETHEFRLISPGLAVGGLVFQFAVSLAFSPIKTT